jgi:hypothetical protein
MSADSRNTRTAQDRAERVTTHLLAVASRYLHHRWYGTGDADPHELRRAFTGYLRDEFADERRQILADLPSTND